ncbi:hypothetical protein NQZ79_g6266 [Umbelopsis isabellina]|nr:hypothetical protein NQZ79_g6266 [Umbelopsis isabellina]
MLQNSKQKWLRFSTLLALSLIALFDLIQAETHYYGLCSCFSPQYDASCCILAQGTMDGNTCITGDSNHTVSMYEQCCMTSGGTSKCKSGANFDGVRPDDPGMYNCTLYPSLAN